MLPPFGEGIEAAKSPSSSLPLAKRGEIKNEEIRNKKENNFIGLPTLNKNITKTIYYSYRGYIFFVLLSILMRVHFFKSVNTFSKSWTVLIS